MGDARIGCSGWAYRDWRGELYADDLRQREWLSSYARVFGTVEVNNTFYRLPSVDMARTWTAETPEGFVFAVKASRYLTHVKRLREAGRIATLVERLEPLVETGKLGPILWQLPESFRRDDERLAGALADLPDGRHCFEFRHPSWFVKETYDLLRDRGAALVIADHPERAYQTRELTADWTYVRFHYGRRGRRGNYSQRELSTWARRIAQWRRRVDVYAYFNNDWEAFAPADARRLRASISS